MGAHLPMKKRLPQQARGGWANAAGVIAGSGGGWTRTTDQGLMSPLLWPLSYAARQTRERKNRKKGKEERSFYLVIVLVIVIEL